MLHIHIYIYVYVIYIYIYTHIHIYIYIPVDALCGDSDALNGFVFKTHRLHDGMQPVRSNTVAVKSAYVSICQHMSAYVSIRELK
jgi:hypothetical protein